MSVHELDLCRDGMVIVAAGPTYVWFRQALEPGLVGRMEVLMAG